MRPINASRHINIAAHVNHDTLIDRAGKLIKIIKLSGIDYVTKDDTTLDNFKNRLNTLWKGFNSEFAIYSYLKRERCHDYPSGEFTNDFARALNDKYRAQMAQTALYCNQWYLAVMTKPPEGVINKGFSFLQHKKDLNQYRTQKQQELDTAVLGLLSALKPYLPRLLTVITRNGVEISEPLSLLSELINFEPFNIRLESSNASASLTRQRLFFNRRTGTVQLGKRFAAVISLKDYVPATYAGMLDRLATLDMEYIITQSYRFLEAAEAKIALRNQQLELEQSKDESVSQTEEISDAFDDVASGATGFGLHHLSVVCYAQSIKQLDYNVATLIAEFGNLDIQAVREDMVSEATFWAQLPGNFSYIARGAKISTKNFAAFASFHNESLGKLHNNHWGDAVTVLETVNHSPYYFNFHHKDVGNFLVFGTMGSGKTLIIGFLIAQSMKFGGKRIIFDKDRGLEILVRALNGTYETLKSGTATGFNPCALVDTVDNREFLIKLFTHLIDLPQHEIMIKKAVEGLYELQPNERQLKHVAPFFGNGAARARFDQWHSTGTHAWLFDNADDSLNLNADVLGFDITHILQSPCKTPALMYLTYRIEQAVDGKRSIMFVDEAWKVLDDGYFKDLINDASRTPRKKNNCLGLATQETSDTANNQATNQAASCKLFFANPNAKAEIYCDELGLTPQELTTIKTMDANQHYFLLRHGSHSTVVRANLAGMDEEIAIISGRESTVKLLDKLRAQVGDDPKDWLPLFRGKV